MFIILLKILVSVFIVLGLVFISERNPKIGGLLVGLPLGTGIMIFFYSIEQGIPFVLQGIPYGICGLVGSLSFGIGFYLGGKFFIKNPVLHVISALCGGFFAFLCISTLITLCKITLLISLVIFLIGMSFAVYFFKHIPQHKKTMPKRFRISALIFRTIFVVIIVLTVTALAQKIGTRWAGFMASFPTTLCPLLIILAYSDKDELYPNVLKHFSFSVTTTVFFYLLVLWLFPILGIYYGIVVIYLLCFLYLYTLNKIKNQLF